MEQCSSCLAIVDNNKIFCSNCGYRLPPLEPEITKKQPDDYFDRIDLLIFIIVLITLAYTMNYVLAAFMFAGLRIRIWVHRRYIEKKRVEEERLKRQDDQKLEFSHLLEELSN